MPVKLSDEMSLAVDVAILLKGKSATQQEAVIDRKLVDLLLAIDDTKSVAQACERLSCSTRYAQRMVRRFSDTTGLQLLKHKGWQGTDLTEEAHQCIALYVAARSCTEQIVAPSFTRIPLASGWE